MLFSSLTLSEVSLLFESMNSDLEALCTRRDGIGRILLRTRRLESWFDAAFVWLNWEREIAEGLLVGWLCCWFRRLNAKVNRQLSRE
jgi:hypothetical protein